MLHNITIRIRTLCSMKILSCGATDYRLEVL